VLRQGPLLLRLHGRYIYTIAECNESLESV
jgi:hypothetical protein